MVSENFKSLKDLYNRIYPALKSKVEELKGLGYSFLTEKELWEYLKNKKWSEEKDLTLFDIVNDVFYIEEKELLHFLSPKNKMEEHLEIENEENEDTIL